MEPAETACWDKHGKHLVKISHILNDDICYCSSYELITRKDKYYIYKNLSYFLSRSEPARPQQLVSEPSKRQERLSIYFFLILNGVCIVISMRQITEKEEKLFTSSINICPKA
jgi:hypothetical protein